ncbi:MAG TPA: class I SAM-dependent methyltransferase [Alphaproteobacteria bacterium]|nr:class I SAM-dependent methyltransferase [Alphaproteobacteria bacterium]HOO51148.1 class I SAM-dependent methyltransferase [Alphaproteobacteria bacterium]
MIYIIALIFVFLIILFMLNFEYYRHKLGVSTSHSSQAMREEILKEIISVAHEKTALKIVDPGSGSGELVRMIARNMPHATVIGMELSPIPFWQSKIKSMLFGPKNALFKMDDFFKFDYSDVDIVVTFLPEPVLHKLADTIKDQLPTGSVVISNAFELPQGWSEYKRSMVQPVLKRYLFCYKK